MPVSIFQWHVEIGIFNNRTKVRFSRFFYNLGVFFVFILVFAFIKDVISATISAICYWNLNSIIAINFEKVVLLEVHNTANKFDIIFLWESYLDIFILFNKESVSSKVMSLLEMISLMDLVYFTTRVPYTSDTSATRTKSMRHDWDTSDMSGTRVLHERDECDTSEKLWFW